VIEAKEDLLNQLEEVIEREDGFLVLDHSVKFYGHCLECRTRIGEEEHLHPPADYSPEDK
jgi:Fur family ferric uptake transcriptional regulator